MNYFEIGKIVNTQGLRGEVRVIPMTDDPARFRLLDSVFVVPKLGSEKELEIESVRHHKQFVLLKFKGINDINEAEKLKSCLVKIPPEWALPLAEDEYYIRDLYDMDVWTDEGEFLGKITDIIATGANDVYAVTPTDGGKAILIPAIAPCVLDVDVPGRKMTVHLLKGLR